MPPLRFDQPALLWLLPLALLALRRRSADVLVFSHLPWLPADARGSRLARLQRAALAATIGLIVIALAGPHLAETREPRTGRGAEISILLDRSASMDDVIRAPGQQSGGALSGKDNKGNAVRLALERFVASRPHDRYALALFSSSVIPVLPFTDDLPAVQAGLQALRVGRGLTETAMGPALLHALRGFEQRKHSGSRVLLLVSDGGALLDEATRTRLAKGLTQQRIALYFLYIRTGPTSPDLMRRDLGPPADGESSGEFSELSLHRFFLSLDSPYQVYQAGDPAAIAAAIADIGRRQNQPLVYEQRVPRIALHPYVYAAALLCAAAAAWLSARQLRSWA